MATLSEALALGVRYHQAGDLRRAEDIYRQVLQADPRNADAWHLLGMAAHFGGRNETAVEHIQKAIALDGGKAVFLSNLGLVLRALGRRDEALACHDAALRLDPGYANAHNNRGSVLRDQGRFAEAIACYHEALRLRPDYAEAHGNLGAAFKARGMLAEAVASYREALRLRPNYAEVHNNLGVALRLQGKLPEATACYQEALRLKPNFAETYNNLASVLRDQGRGSESETCYRQALRLKPDFADAHKNLGTLLQEQSDLAGALACLERARALAPTDGLRIKAALALPVINESAEEMRRQRRRVEDEVARLLGETLTVDDPVNAVGVTAFELAYQGQNDRDLQASIAALYARSAPSLHYVAPHCLAGALRPQGKIRVGLLSRFFYNHTIGKLNDGLVRNLCRDDFHVTLFRFPGKDDDLARRMQEDADAAFTLPVHLEAARRQIAEQRLDVLFYADIGMDPFTYFLAFARLAPVQCVTWGHPVTTGIPTIDYFLSSDLLETDGADRHYTERLVRLKTLPTYYYRPALSAAPRGRAAFGLSDADHLYGCPQSLFKLHPDFDAPLAAVLRRDPRGRLVLIEGKHPHWKELLLRRFRRAMPDVADRILFLPRQSHDDFLHLTAACDVLLDPIHFGSGNTCYEGLALGAPVVTWPSEFLRGRVTLGLYRKMGVTDCVARDAEEYVEIAVRLGTEPDYREAVRAKILAACPVIYEDAEAVRELERFFREAVAPV